MPLKKKFPQNNNGFSVLIVITNIVHMYGIYIVIQLDFHAYTLLVFGHKLMQDQKKHENTLNRSASKIKRMAATRCVKILFLSYSIEIFYLLKFFIPIRPYVCNQWQIVSIKRESIKIIMILLIYDYYLEAIYYTNMYTYLHI